MQRLLLGILAEGSGFDKGVYVWRVSMPLFVPSDNMVLSWSERIGGGARKYDTFDKDALVEAIITAIEGLGSEEDGLAQMVARGSPSSPNRRLHEVVAYAQLLLGDLPAAGESLERAESGTATAPLEQEVMERVHLIGRLVEEDGRERAVGQLDKWCDHTAGALGLRRSVPFRRS